jgi:hypothetical protein
MGPVEKNFLYIWKDSVTKNKIKITKTGIDVPPEKISKKNCFNQILASENSRKE